MPWRLIGFLFILAAFLIFSGFNVHTVTIYFGPFALTDIPLFVVITFTFILGAFTTLPFSLMTSYKKRKKILKAEKVNGKNAKKITEGPVDQTVLPENNTTPLEDKKTKSKTKKK